MCFCRSPWIMSYLSLGIRAIFVGFSVAISSARCLARISRKLSICSWKAKAEKGLDLSSKGYLDMSICAISIGGGGTGELRPSVSRHARRYSQPASRASWNRKCSFELTSHRSYTTVSGRCFARSYGGTLLGRKLLPKPDIIDGLEAYQCTIHTDGDAPYPLLCMMM